MTAAQPQSDRDWLDGLRRRDSAAIGALRGALVTSLRAALAGRSGAGEADLEDDAQEAVLLVLDRLDQFRGESRLLTWARTIAIRTALTRLRRRGWEHVGLEELDLPEPLAPAAEAAEARAVRGDAVSALRRAIDTALTDRQRRAILAELAGMPLTRLAEELGTNPNALYKLVHDARKRLRAALEADGIELADVSSDGLEASS